MAEAMARPGNPSSLHGPGRLARALVERARRRLADELAVAPDRVVFTSGGTEANHLALLGTGGRCLVSAIEHASVLDSGSRCCAPVRWIAMAGSICRSRALSCPAIDPALVSVMLANNETGDRATRSRSGETGPRVIRRCCIATPSRRSAN